MQKKKKMKLGVYLACYNKEDLQAICTESES